MQEDNIQVQAIDFGIEEVETEELNQITPYASAEGGGCGSCGACCCCTNNTCK